MPHVGRPVLSRRRLISLVVAIAALIPAAPTPVAAVSSGTPGPVLFAIYDGNLGNDYLYAVVPGSEPVMIPNTAGARGGRWSPDGRVIAFSVYMEGIYLINVDGSGKRLIVPDVPDARAGYPVWSPDGTKIAYIVDEIAGDIGIFSTVSGESMVFHAGLATVDDWTDKYLLGTAWRDYDEMQNGNQEIAKFTFNNPSGDLSQGVVTLLTDDPQQDGVPRLSPDGGSILWAKSNFVWHVGGDGHNALWVMDADGSNQRYLADLGYQVTWPAWSPDGTEIVFGPIVSAVNVATGDTRTIAINAPFAEDGFDWAPLPGSTEDFPVDGVRALAYPDKSVVASASESATAISPRSLGETLVQSSSAVRSVSITQRLGEPAYATLKIYRPSGALVRSVIFGLKTGHVSYTWNGRLNNGKLAPVGRYKIVAKAVDLAGNVKHKVLYVKVVR
jgi:hypothetical protein